MSQINYQAMRFDPHPTQQMVDACCARIAELEAERDEAVRLLQLVADRQDAIRADRAEAELAEIVSHFEGIKNIDSAAPWALGEIRRILTEAELAALKAEQEGAGR